jgi:hypothetical protein
MSHFSETSRVHTKPYCTYICVELVGINYLGFPVSGFQKPRNYFLMPVGQFFVTITTIDWVIRRVSDSTWVD